LSLAIGVPKTTPVAVQVEFALTVTADGAVIVGFVLSRTVTICVAVAIFPALSVAVQVTVVFPIGKAAGALFVTTTAEQLSLATGNPKLTPVAVHPALAFTIFGAGAVITGFELSTTVTVCVAVLIFPLPSVTVQVTIVVPKAYTAVPLLITAAIEQLSETIGVPKFKLKATQFALADTVKFEGAVIVGSVLSVTVTI
jgi:hypothetical protein